MKDSQLSEVYSAASSLEAYLLRDVLRDAGIEARVVGDHLENATGDLPFVAIAPRIWVRAEHSVQARKIIADHKADSSSESPAVKWVCKGCGEHNEPSFEMCWNCQKSSSSAV